MGKLNPVLKKLVIEDLQRMQAMSLEDKVERTKLLIKEWYEAWEGKVAVSFSGGKDSTVLLHIARQIYPEIEAVFFNTGLEYPEILAHVNKFENVRWIRPKLTFKETVLKYGYPVVGKETSLKIWQVNHTKSANVVKLRMEGIRPNGEYSPLSIIPQKWKYLFGAPFQVGAYCCNVMKKRPAHQYCKETGNKFILATMAEESELRKTSWIRYGCNAFDQTNNPTSRPMSFWTEQDVLKYIYQNNVPLAEVYGQIIEQPCLFNGGVQEYTLTGVRRTGCMFCMYGVHLEKHPNRFERMKHTHPKIYNWCMKSVEEGGLGLDKVLNYLGVEH